MSKNSKTEERIYRLVANSVSRVDIPSNSSNPVQVVGFGEGQPQQCICLFRVDCIITFAIDQQTADTQISNSEKSRLAKAGEQIDLLRPDLAKKGMYARAASETSPTLNGIDKQEYIDP